VISAIPVSDKCNVQVVCDKWVFALYGCETWSLALREECMLWVFENRVFEENIWAYEGGGIMVVEKTT
jgi:hypothetical protein